MMQIFILRNSVEYFIEQLIMLCKLMEKKLPISNIAILHDWFTECNSAVRLE